MKTNKRAISLIVLVVTIIVLAILAATVIVTISNSGIINRSEDTVKSYDLTQVRDMANLAWAEALIEYSGQSGVTDTTYQDYVQTYLTNAGVDITDYNVTASMSGVSVTLREDQTTTEYAGLTITVDTEGFTFIPVDGAEVTDERIANLQVGDKVIYGDYVYVYGQEKDRTIGIVQGTLEDTDTSVMSSWVNLDAEGWGVSVLDEGLNKTELGQLCGTIFGKPVVSMKNTFGNWYVLDYGTMRNSALRYGFTMGNEKSDNVSINSKYCNRYD